MAFAVGKTGHPLHSIRTTSLVRSARSRGYFDTIFNSLRYPFSTRRLISDQIKLCKLLISLVEPRGIEPLTS